MSYLVIARKWRPAQFHDVIGQEHVTRTLSNALTSSRVGHAYLFSGPRGVGKTTVARILARSLNCEEGEAAVPCNECASCKAILNGSSVDVLEIDGASNTGVDNVRELRESVGYMPSQGKYKVYIIDEVHMLSKGAFNALLKTLEEPPPHVVFIFATTEPHKVPQTIHSRCQRFDFKRISIKEIHSRLLVIAEKESIEAADAALYMLAREAQGSMRDAQSLMEQVMAFTGAAIKADDVAEALGIMDRCVLMELTGAVAGGDGKKCLNLVEKIYDFGYDLKKAAGDLLEQIRDMVVVKVTGDASLPNLPASEADELKALSEGSGLDRLQMLFSIISRGYEDVSRSAHPRFSFEMALLKAANLDDIEPLSELIARLAPPGRPSGEKGIAKAPARMTSGGGPASQAGGGGGLRHCGGNEGSGSKGSGSARGVARKGSVPAESSAPVTAAVAAVATAVATAATTAEGDSPVVAHIRALDPKVAEHLEGARFLLDGSKLEIIIKGQRGFLVVKEKFLEEACSAFYKVKVGINIKVAEGGSGEGEAAASGVKAADGSKSAGHAKSAGKAKSAGNEGDRLVIEAVRILDGKVIEDRRKGG